MKPLRLLRYGSLALLGLILTTGSFISGARFGPSVLGRLGLPELAAPSPVPFLETSGEPASVAPVLQRVLGSVEHRQPELRGPQGLWTSSKMTYGAIRGMVDSLGDTGHTRFLDAAAFQSEQSQFAEISPASARKSISRMGSR